jgi:surfeit locus 1 family protein
VWIDYAADMANLQFRFCNLRQYRFRPSWVGAFATICCIPLFIHLGQWQFHKAQTKFALQATYDQYDQSAPVTLPTETGEPESWRYKQVKVKGRYLPDYQIFLDNQVEGEQVGYHVVTPLQIDGVDEVVLIDRGWIPAMENHLEVPKVVTPLTVVEIDGQVWLPSTKFYSLEDKGEAVSKVWQPIWQNMDMKRYVAVSPIKVLPLVIRLNPKSNAGGFVRNWVRPDDRAESNLSYAYQWFGFAFAALAIFIVVSFKKVELD